VSEHVRLRDYRWDWLVWMAQMSGVYQAMSSTERASLEAWEKQHLDGTSGTSDWPGWTKYIGSQPVPPDAPLRPRRKSAAHVALAVFRRDRFTCQECGSHDELEVDHIIPVSRGGANELANYQTLCMACNRKKGVR
jgi:5-methylcytosine-specific restriction enzyme A